MVELVRKLRVDTPPIYLDESRLEESVLQVNPSNISDSDVGTIAERLRSLF